VASASTSSRSGSARGQPLRGDARAGAALDQRFEIFEILVADSHKQSVVVLERAWSDPLQDHVLPDTLHARLVVADRITGAGVKQPWWRPLVPDVSSPRSRTVTLSPRSVRS
jgi:hypothetical protein